MFNPWVGRKKWQPTPVFLPGEAHGRRSPWTDEPGGLQSTGSQESGTTEHTHEQVLNN